MALAQGTCSVADDGTVTKSGAAGAVYDLLLADLQAEPFVTLGPDGKPKTGTCDVTTPVKRGLARQARGVAMLIPYLTANAVTTTTVSAGGLQRDNTAGNPATLAPAAPVNLTGTVS